MLDILILRQTQPLQSNWTMHIALRENGKKKEEKRMSGQMRKKMRPLIDPCLMYCTFKKP